MTGPDRGRDVVLPLPRVAPAEGLPTASFEDDAEADFVPGFVEDFFPDTPPDFDMGLDACFIPPDLLPTLPPA